jgi:hypothetical protein
LNFALGTYADEVSGHHRFDGCRVMFRDCIRPSVFVVFQGGFGAHFLSRRGRSGRGGFLRRGSGGLLFFLSRRLLSGGRGRLCFGRRRRSFFHGGGGFLLRSGGRCFLLLRKGRGDEASGGDANE